MCENFMKRQFYAVSNGYIFLYAFRTIPTDASKVQAHLYTLPFYEPPYMANGIIYGLCGCQIADILNCDFKGIFSNERKKERLKTLEPFARYAIFIEKREPWKRLSPPQTTKLKPHIRPAVAIAAAAAISFAILLQKIQHLHLPYGRWRR